MEFEDMDLEETRTQAGMKQFGNILAVIIILVVAAFGDVMYLQLMNSHFPGGFLMVLCYVGAFTSFAAVAYMLIGKSILFTPGLQMVVAWFVFLVELTLIALNIILVFQSDGANSTGFLAAWLQMAPATPVVNMAGVAILFFLDEAGRMRHEDVELAWDIKRQKRKLFRATAKASLRLQNQQLNFLVTEMDQAVASPESMEAIRKTAIMMNQRLLGQLSGGRTYSVPAELPAGRTVNSDPEPPTTSPTRRPAAPTPEPEKPNLLQRLFGGAKPEPAAQSEQSQPFTKEELMAFRAWERQQQSPATETHVQPAQFAEPSPAAHTDTPAQRPAEQEYVVSKRKQPSTTDHLVLPTDPGFRDIVERLSPLTVAPTGKTNGNGASQNHH